MTGFTGERGYEVYCEYTALEEIYDLVLEAGKPHDIMAIGLNALDKARVESGWMFYPYDINEETTAWETAQAHTVPSHKDADYRGKKASEAVKNSPRFITTGLVVDHNDGAGDCEIFSGAKKVGTITSGVWSHRLGQSLAIAQIETDFAKLGTTVSVKGEGVDTTAVITGLPFYDSGRVRLRK